MNNTYGNVYYNIPSISSSVDHILYDIYTTNVDLSSDECYLHPIIAVDMGKVNGVVPETAKSDTQISESVFGVDYDRNIYDVCDAGSGDSKTT